MKIMSQLDHLVDYLDLYEVDYQRNDDNFMKRVYIENEKGSFSVIYGRGSDGYYYGLLEVSINKQEPIGFLSSFDVIEKYREWLSE